MQPLLSGNKIELKYNNAKINFHFSNSDLIAGSRMMYRYRLKGVDNNWSVPTRNTYISYNLLPGIYSFHLQASYNSSDWIDSEYPALITVLPPFWKTLWFIMLLGLLIISGGFLLHIYLSKRKLRSEGHKLVEYFTTIENQYHSIDELLWDMARNIISRL